MSVRVDIPNNRMASFMVGFEYTPGFFEHFILQMTKRIFPPAVIQFIVQYTKERRKGLGQGILRSLLLFRCANGPSYRLV
jgi:hypothetical protein